MSYFSESKIENIGKMYQSVTLFFKEKRFTEFWTLLSSDFPLACPGVSLIEDAKADSVGPLRMELGQH